MSAINVFPVYTVKTHDGKPCGHQHQTEEAAENCAINIAARFKGKAQTVLCWPTRLPADSSENSAEYKIMSHFEVPLSRDKVESEFAIQTQAQEAT